MELTPQNAKSLTVAKLREELTERGLASDGLKVRSALPLTLERVARQHEGEALPSAINVKRVGAVPSPSSHAWFCRPRGGRVDTVGIGHRK